MGLFSSNSRSFTMAEIKAANALYFQKGNDKFFGVTGRKLVKSPALKCQVMIEKQVMRHSDHTSSTSYSVRKIQAVNKIGHPERFDTIRQVVNYIGKEVKI